jgi:hypothetical protein
VVHATTQLKHTLENMVDISVPSVTLVGKNFSIHYYYKNNQKQNKKNTSKNPWSSQTLE